MTALSALWRVTVGQGLGYGIAIVARPPRIYREYALAAPQNVSEVCRALRNRNSCSPQIPWHTALSDGLVVCRMENNRFLFH